MHSKRRGEIAATLTLFSLFVMLAGTFLGTNRTVQKTALKILGKAQSTCSYSAVTLVKDQTTGQVLSSSQLNNFTWGVSNERQNQVSPAAVFADQARFTYETQNLPASEVRSNASVKLFHPDTWEVADVFCSGQGCPSADHLATQETSSVISGFDVACGTAISEYGWVVRLKTNSPPPSTTPPPQTMPSPTTAPAASGDMEVKVVALDYPQKTGAITGPKPASCTRQTPSDERPLYLSSLTITAVGPDTRSITMEKNKGHISFTGLPAGTYTLSVSGADNRGYTLWEGCKNQQWTVTAGGTAAKNSTHTRAYIALQNEKDGIYTTETTESACTSQTHPSGTKQGRSNLIQGVGGTVCYFGTEKPDVPEPTIEPTQAGASAQPPLPTSVPPTTAPSSPDGCNAEVITGSGPYRILFLPDSFGDLTAFKNLASSAVDEITKTNLTDIDIIGRATFLALTDVGHNFQCRLGSGSASPRQFMCDNTTLIQTLMSQCASAAAVVIGNNGNAGGATSDGMSDDVNIAYVPRNLIKVVPHELGHTIARLADEYIFTEDGNTFPAVDCSQVSWKEQCLRVFYAPNCSHDSSCSNWKGVNPAPQCKAGCTWTNWYRYLEKGVMGYNREESFSRRFSPIDLRAFDQKMPLSLGLAGTENVTLQTTDVINILIDQDQKQNLQLVKVQRSAGYPLDLAQRPPGDSYYQVFVETTDGEPRSVGYISPFLIRIMDPGGIDASLKKKINLFLPFDKNISALIIKDQSSNTKLTIVPSRYFNTQEIKGSVCGNNVCDTSGGETAASCSQDCRIRDNAFKQEWRQLRADCNGDKSVNSIDYAQGINQYGKERPVCDPDANNSFNSLDLSIIIANLNTSL